MFFFVFFLQRRIAEPQIFFETFQAVLRACPLTFGEVAEAVGTLRGFPLQGGRRGLRYDILRIPALKKISAFSAEHKPWLCRLCAFCVLTRQRQQLCISVSSSLAEPLRLCDSALNKSFPHRAAQPTSSNLFFLFFLQRRIAEPLIIFETFQAVLRAYPLTFGEAAEAVGTLHGFPLRGGR